MTNIIEKENCAHCNGRGAVGHPDDPNGRCSACRGLGTQPTKRGQAVANKWVDMIKIPARRLSVGTKILLAGKVMTIAYCDHERSIANVACLTLENGDEIQFNPDDIVTIHPDGRQREDMIIELIKFRESLLKSGLPRKKRC